MCDKELLLAYLYDELPATDRQTCDRHLASCVECRAEVDALRGTRTHLLSWAPPEPDLNFQIVRGAKPAVVDVPPARWWRVSPAWGLAAAAVLTLAVSAAVANVEVKMGSDGVVVRTGWNRDASGAVQDQAAVANAASAAELHRVEARLNELAEQLAARQNAAVSATANASRMSDAEIVRLVKLAVSESEQRQQGVLAHQILQVNRDTELARRNDVDRLLTAYRQLQGTSYETSQRQKALEDHVLRVGLQR